MHCALSLSWKSLAAIRWLRPSFSSIWYLYRLSQVHRMCTYCDVSPNMHIQPKVPSNGNIYKGLWALFITVTSRCCRNLSYWERCFLWNLRRYRLKGLGQHQIAVVRQGPRYFGENMSYNKALVKYMISLWIPLIVFLRHVLFPQNPVHPPIRFNIMVRAHWCRHPSTNFVWVAYYHAQ